ncbi:AAA family ATPase [Nocardia barduliensis]|uniref:AAA family ATPase n=1 Tax=Nocardia barduliensis TaxID=2736643 RepID=UPI0015730597|nr:AAA family ATPase [Nocardia barduliensis]
MYPTLRMTAIGKKNHAIRRPEALGCCGGCVTICELLVLVNGLPGSGKSTLAPALARELGAHLITKDAVKEALGAGLDHATVPPNIGAIAMEAAWALAGALSGVVLVDSWWFKPRDIRYAAAGITTSGATRAVEVWCSVPADLARARYRGRTRAALYHDDAHLAQDWDRWARLAEPLALTPVVVVDTTASVDCPELARQVMAAATVAIGDVL